MRSAPMSTSTTIKPVRSVRLARPECSVRPGGPLVWLLTGVLLVAASVGPAMATEWSIGAIAGGASAGVNDGALSGLEEAESHTGGGPVVGLVTEVMLRDWFGLQTGLSVVYPEQSFEYRLSPGGYFETVSFRLWHFQVPINAKLAIPIETERFRGSRVFLLGGIYGVFASSQGTFSAEQESSGGDIEVADDNPYQPAKRATLGWRFALGYDLLLNNGDTLGFGLHYFDQGPLTFEDAGSSGVWWVASYRLDIGGSGEPQRSPLPDQPATPDQPARPAPEPVPSIADATPDSGAAPSVEVGDDAPLVSSPDLFAVARKAVTADDESERDSARTALVVGLVSTPEVEIAALDDPGIRIGAEGEDSVYLARRVNGVLRVALEYQESTDTSVSLENGGIGIEQRTERIDVVSEPVYASSSIFGRIGGSFSSSDTSTTTTGNVGLGLRYFTNDGDAFPGPEGGSGRGWDWRFVGQLNFANSSSEYYDPGTGTNESSSSSMTQFFGMATLGRSRFTFDRRRAGAAEQNGRGWSWGLGIGVMHDLSEPEWVADMREQYEQVSSTYGSSSAYSIDDFYNPTTVIPVPLLSFDRYRVNPGTGKYTFSQWSGFLWPSPFTISLAWQRSF